MTLKKLLPLCAVLVLSACGAGREETCDLPFDMPEIRLPSIPERSVLLTDFGAVGDGVTPATEAFAAAIRSLSERGGGRLVVPAGIWLTGPIGLESHIDLHLESEAVIVFSSDRSLYPVIETNFEGLDVRRCLSPIHALGATDIAITGAGVIDGNGDAFEPVAMKDAEVLKEDPCVNSAAGKLYLSSAGGRIVALKAGDPRWWNAVQPEVIREKELTVQEEDYTWDFTQKTIYDTEDLELTTIIGNARIFATEEDPAHVLMSRGIGFDSAATLGTDGVPASSAVEILTKGYGAVKVTAVSSDGLGTVQVLAGGDRYAVLADGEEHTVLLGDLTGENSIYVVAGSAVLLQKVTWTKDLTPDAALEALAAPKVTVTPSKLDEGTAEDVTVSWGAVANAADYVFTFDGKEQVLTETSFTLAAADVAALPVGEHAITVTARPVPTSSKYAASAAAKATLQINKVVSGGEVTLAWDFSSAAWQSALEAGAASAKGSNQANWTVSVDGLTYASGSKNGKWDASGYIQPNGSGSTTERVFTFTAPEDGVLIVTASSAKSGEARNVAVVDAGGEERTQSVDAQAELTFEIQAGDVAIYPKAGIRFYKIAFEP